MNDSKNGLLPYNKKSLFYKSCKDWFQKTLIKDMSIIKDIGVFSRVKFTF